MVDCSCTQVGELVTEIIHVPQFGGGGFLLPYSCFGIACSIFILSLGDDSHVRKLNLVRGGVSEGVP